MDQAVVKLLTDNIISILSTKASLLWGTRDAIEDIKDELISMQSFLVDADRKGLGSEGEKTWVAKVRDMAYDVEDIIDKFMYHMNRLQIRGRSSWILHHTIYFPKNLWVRHQTATKIQKINGKIKGAIPERKQRYVTDHIEGTSSKDNQKRGTLLKKLPNSIGQLLNLQTLDIVDTQIEALPRGIGKLQNLQSLRMFRYTGNWNDFRYLTGMQLQTPSIAGLKNLQIVTSIEANHDLIRQSRSLTQLTTFGITNVKEVDETDLCISIQNMRLLRSLSIMVTNEEESLRMNALSSLPLRLQKLYLAGKLEKVPQWFCSLQSLTYLRLHWPRLGEDLLPHIADLPYLRQLNHVEDYEFALFASKGSYFVWSFNSKYRLDILFIVQ
ncbi:disease resistance protein rpm1 [Quercus suber]|uniref:Disease resistance protein rpm1 n=1 Tax=Quercus suber TaxID=58331 RepID=A0AAW0IUE5_QUESU